MEETGEIRQRMQQNGNKGEGKKKDERGGGRKKGRMEKSGKA